MTRERQEMFRKLLWIKERADRKRSAIKRGSSSGQGSVPFKDEGATRTASALRAPLRGGSNPLPRARKEEH